MYIGDDVLAVDVQVGIAGQAQRGMQRSPVLGSIDVRPGEHCVASGLEAGGAGQIYQQAHRLVGDAVLAVVDVEVADRGGEPLRSVGVIGEELAQMGVSDLLVMPEQCVPCRGGRDVEGLGDLRHGTHSPTLAVSGAAGQ